MPFYRSITLALCLIASSLYADTTKGKVVRVADGDTMTVLDSSNTQHKIRFAGIDAPEKKQAYGDASKKHLSDKVFNKDVTVEFSNRDMDGRVVGTVFLEGENINKMMVVDGYAWRYITYDKEGVYNESEQAARNDKKGLWKDTNPLESWKF